MAIEEVVTVTLDDAPLEAGAAAADGLADALGEVQTAADAIDFGAIDTSGALETAGRVVDKVKDGFAAAKGAAAKAGATVKANFVGAFAGLPGVTRAVNLAKSAVSGLGSAAKAAGGAAKSAFGSLGKSIKDAIPSTLGNLAAKGIEKLAESALNAVAKFGQVAAGADNMKRALDQVTRGRGADAFAHLTEVAKGINKPIQSVTDQFIALRKQGLDNIQATKAIKLQADLEAVGVSSEDAAAQVEAFKAALAGGENADAAIKKIATQFGAVGDGSDAASKGANTTAGALEKLSLLFEQTLGKIVDQAGPQLTEFMTGLANGLADIDPAVMKDMAGATIDLLKAITPLIPAMVKVAQWSITGSATGIKMVSKTIEGLTWAFHAAKGAAVAVGTAVAGAWSAVSGAVSTAAAGVGAAVKAIGSALAAIGTAINGAISSITTGVSAGLLLAYTKATSWIGSFSSLGSAVISGLVAGIKGAAKSAVEAVTNVGADLEAGLKGALGIKSPSKVAKAIAENFVGTFADTAEIDVPDMARNLNTEIKSGAPDGSSGAGGRPAIGTLHLTVYAGGSNATAEDIALEVEAAIRRAML